MGLHCVSQGGASQIFLTLRTQRFLNHGFSRINTDSFYHRGREETRRFFDTDSFDYAQDRLHRLTLFYSHRVHTPAYDLQGQARHQDTKILKVFNKKEHRILNVQRRTQNEKEKTTDYTDFTDYCLPQKGTKGRESIVYKYMRPGLPGCIDTYGVI